MECGNEMLYMGVDLSTQGLKVTVIDGGFRTVCEKAINFDRDLPAFGTKGGGHQHDDGLTVTSPAKMWVAAFDLLLDRLQTAGCPFGRIGAVSGSGQQHGSVWLAKGAAETLGQLSPDRPLADQVDGLFTRSDSPIWMDSSTGAECAALEDALGGAQRVADRTGSRAYERFTGNQIAKIARLEPDVYAATERIALVSSFAAGLLIGGYAPIDMSDGSGMNLLDIRTHDWSPEALAATAPDLAEKLGAPVASHSVVGQMSDYFCQRYGFSPDCKVIAFSGDNPNSLAGLRIASPGDLALSLGTSITIFGSLTDPCPSGVEGHIFVNPVDPDAYMAMLCIKNGTLLQEGARDRVAEGSWDRFGELLLASPVGNAGQIGFFFDDPEITPPIMNPGYYRFDQDGKPVDAFDAASEVRAVVESQLMLMRIHGSRIGLVPTCILATGGGSKDQAVVKTMADVFGVPVHVAQQSDSASLGAAYRAIHGWRCDDAGELISFADVVAGAPAFELAAEPDMEAHAVYTSMVARFGELEAGLV